MYRFYFIILLTYYKGLDLFMKLIITLMGWWQGVTPVEALAISQLIMAIKFSQFQHKAQLINFNYFWNADAQIHIEMNR